MDENAAATGSNEPQVTAGSGRRATIEIAIGYLLILSVIWTPRPLQRILWVVAAAGVAIILWRSFEGWRAMGFATANFSRSLWIVGAAAAISAVAIVISIRLQALHLPGGGPVVFAGTYLAYAIWTCVQQFLLQGFFLLRLLHVVRRPAIAALAAAGLFAAAHLPNPVLTPITLIWGLAACLLFLRYRSIYPLMLAHAILGITVAITVPGPVDHNMRVGLGYLTYQHHAHSHRRELRKTSRPGFLRIEI